MTTNKKLGLLLLPLVPLSVLGIVEVASRVMPSPTVAQPGCELPAAPAAVALPSAPSTAPDA